MRAQALIPAFARSLLAALAGCGSSGGKADGATDTKFSTAASSLPARWWIWTEAADPARNPIDDEPGAQCATGQPEDVWFLAGTHGGSANRTCAIPHGRPLYFPVLNQICEAEGAGPDAVEACVAGPPEVAEATLDGKALRVVSATSGGIFRITAREGSTTFSPPGDLEAVAAGLRVGPLSVPDGKHTLRIIGRSGAFALNVTYRLTVG